MYHRVCRIDPPGNVTESVVMFYLDDSFFFFFCQIGLSGNVT